ncbi:TadE family protein [Nostocoides sp. HKS02]|uniref:TadE family protein n=1 Tax=Nostocoides sp. HKS02 TaxID=1813880 RepID=UPI0012B48B81|nr:TadE family protein [Tetrasphaera sp. HKS02]QGN56762.1 pilus assembly protein [Tetrasphaera sp. HKS02]
MALPKARGHDSGSAVADFVLVAALVSVLFVAVLQVGLALYVRNTLIACAAEGARLGARADGDPTQGVARTRELIASSLSARYSRDVTAQVTEVDGVQVLSVRVLAPLPVIGPLGPDRGFDVVGRAFLERQ